MKKIIAVVASLLLAVGTLGCGSKEVEVKVPQETSPEAQAMQEQMQQMMQYQLEQAQQMGQQQGQQGQQAPQQQQRPQY